MINNRNRNFSFPILLISLPVFISCTSVESHTTNSIKGTDYSKKSSWLTLPQNMEEHPVDVFFVYPTMYQGERVQDITNPQQIEKSKGPLYSQASVFSNRANIYAPMYRQLGKSGFAQSDAQLQLLIGEEDVKQAFLYYLKHYNKGKPFIIAGHNQGSSTLMSLLRNFTSAQVIDGGLACIIADETVLSDYPIEGIYHRDDYSLSFIKTLNNMSNKELSHT